MTDNRTTELTAMERLRAMLDERGVEWRKWTKGQVETKWFVPSGMTEFDNHFCGASVSKDHREGPLHYKGYVVSPQAAIEASLGKADDAGANAGDANELGRIAELEGTIEQLEARISALAAENAVLKQARRSPRKGPRCPLRVAGFDQPDTCDERCAWLVDVTYRNEYTDEKKHIGRMCSEVAKTLDVEFYVMRPVNYEKGVC